MSDWLAKTLFAQSLTEPERQSLARIHVSRFARGSILFQPGDAVRGFAIVLSGRVGVYLSGPGGRDILLYDITPGQTCVQSTLGILGGEDYSAEAICETDCELVLIPRDRFQSLLADAPAFRDFVFGAFAVRFQAMMHLLEQVSFVRVENRLAAAILAMTDGENRVKATHQELATKIGTAREVVSRRLDALARRGFVKQARGVLQVIDRDGLERFSENF